MSDEHSRIMQDDRLNGLKRRFSIAAVVLIAGIFFIFRNQIAGYLVYSFSYLVWSLNLFGRIIPPQGMWIALVILILYIAVGSFYGKRSKVESSPIESDPAVGSVEAMADWIEVRRRGVYFKWRIAYLLGHVHQSHSRNTSGRLQPPPPEVEAFLDAGVNRSYMDFPTPTLFKKNEPTVLDIDLEPVLDYLEEQMEIRR